MSEPEHITGTEVAVPEPTQRATSLRDNLPPIGQYFWVTVAEDEQYADDGDKFFGFCWTDDQPVWRKRRKYRKGRKPLKQIEERLMAVEHIASNHIVFTTHEAYIYNGSRTQEDSVRLTFEEFMQYARPAPEWKEVITRRMDALRDAMQAETQRLYDEAQKANALPPSETEHAPTADAPFALAIRTLDPAIEKRKLLALKKNIPIVAKNIKYLAREQAAQAKNLMAPELFNLQAMEKKLRVVEDKIFTLEVYAGLQEEVKQIGDGKPAKPDEKITVRQSLLFMDEETLFDFDKGGMDFTKLEDFDKWVAQPESLNRVLPELKGIVAFRVRREDKDYGPITELWEAFAHAKWNAKNMETYLLIRNGERVYRIASEVDFQPRLIPLKDEFEGHFTVTHKGWTRNFKTGERDPDTTERITPADFSYDKHVEKLRDHLKQYNRIVVLLQGLLDRSECFHPHPPINLANENDMNEWLNLVRDEEGALESGALLEPWEEYRDRCNASIEAGDWIYQRYNDGRRRPDNSENYSQSRPPNITQVYKLRKGNKGDIVRVRYGRTSRGWGDLNEGRPAEECVGIDGVEVRWETPAYSYARYHGGDYTYHGRMWIPLTEVFNMMAYQLGDYKKYLCDRRHKGEYLQWAAPLLTAEKWQREMRNL